MDFFNNNNHHGYQASMVEGFMNRVYGWMCAGLSVTAGVAYYLSPEVNPQAFMAVKNGLLFACLMQFALVMYFSYAWRSLSVTTLSALFICYSALTGVVLSPVLYIYTGTSVFYVFMITAGMFATMAVYGTVTKSDLSSMGNILLMGLFGLIIANVMNFFIASAQFDLAISCVGVGIFSMLVAYDVQKLKNLSQQMVGHPEEMEKVALMGALHLYLDVINLFLYLLRLFGKKRN